MSKFKLKKLLKESEGKLTEGDKSLAYFQHIGYDIFDSIHKLDNEMKKHSVAKKSGKIKKIIKGLYKLESDLGQAINDLDVPDYYRGYDKKRFKKRTEGKLTEVNKNNLYVADERYVGKYIIWVLSDNKSFRTAIMGKKGFDNFSSNDPDDLKKLWNLTKKFKGKPIPDIATEGTCGYGENGELGEEPAGPHLIKKKKIKEKKLNEAKPYETILRQLGGNRFVAMTGAKNLGTSTKKDLSFSIGRNAKKVTHVHIKLTSMDLYDVEFINMRGAKRKVIKKVKGVYGDMLPKIFQKYTGMRTRL